MIESYYREKTDYNKVSGGRMKGIVGLLGDIKGKKILDIGCGEGIMGKALKARTGAIVDGTDISPLAVEKASKVLDHALQADLESEQALPEIIAKGDYDIVMMSEVLEHLFYPELVLRKIALSAKKDAKVVISVPNILFWKNRLKILFGKFEYTSSGLMDRGHIHFFSWRSFCKMIDSEGFKIEECRHHAPTRILRPLANIFPGLAAFQFVVRISRK